MTENERQVKETQLITPRDWGYEPSWNLSQIVEFVEQHRNDYHDFKINGYSLHEDGSELEIYGLTYETDQEVEVRISRKKQLEKDRLLRKEFEELETLKSLKEKYEG